MTDNQLIWTVTVDRESTRIWRSAAGQEAIHEWCAAHGWDANDVLAESARVFGYSDGQAFVNADLIVRDDKGRAQWDDQYERIRTTAGLARLAMSLPEGIGTVE